MWGRPLVGLSGWKFTGTLGKMRSMWGRPLVGLSGWKFTGTQGKMRSMWGGVA